MAKNEVKTVEIKKNYKVKIKFDGSSTAAIFRPGFPFIIDIITESIKWLSHVYVEDEIEIVGEKPVEVWKMYFPEPKPAEEVPVTSGESAVVEQVVEATPVDVVSETTTV